MNPAATRTSRGLPFDTTMSRAIFLVPLSMALWWFVLKQSSLWLLRFLAYVPLGMMISPPGLVPVKVNASTGEWVFNVAVKTTAKDLRTERRQAVDSLGFAVDEDSVAVFAGGWFAYLGLAMSAVALSKGQTRRVLKGVGIQTGINILCLTAYAFVLAYGSAVNTPNGSGPTVWMLKYVYYLIDLVLPFAGPFIVALLVHPEWQAYFTAPDRGVPSSRQTAKK